MVIVSNFGFAFLSFLLFQGTNGLKQYVGFYTVANCENNAERTVTNASFTNIRPLNQPITVNYRSLNIFGMWQIGRCFGTSTTTPCTTGAQAIEWIHHVANEDICIPVEGTPLPTGFDIRRLGDPKMSEPQLALFDKPNFTPDSIVVTVTSQGLTSISLTAKSLFFTGNHAWTLYDGVGHTGRGRCLRPEQNVARRGYGFTTQPIIDESIRSVRFGCNGADASLSSSASLLALLFASIYYFGKNCLVS